MTFTHRSKSLWTYSLLVVVTVTGIACGSSTSDNSGSAAAADSSTAAATSAPPKVAGDSITDDGKLLVGSEVKPGTYRATVPKDSIGCYYARLKDLDGGMDSIIANGLGQPGDKVTVTIKASDKGVRN